MKQSMTALRNTQIVDITTLMEIVILSISVPECSTIKQVLENVSCTMSITEFFKKKNELLMEYFIKACFLKTKNYYLLTGKELTEKSFKSTNKATIKNHIDIDDYLNVVFNNKSQSVV